MLIIAQLNSAGLKGYKPYRDFILKNYRTHAKIGEIIAEIYFSNNRWSWRNLLKNYNLKANDKMVETVPAGLSENEPQTRSEAGETLNFNPGKARNGWQLFTSHGLVLISILNKPGQTVREIGLELNLTDRAVALAIADLVKDGYLERRKVGRRTFYQVNEDHALKYPVSPYGFIEPPRLTVRALRAENLATHAGDKRIGPKTK